MPFPVHLFSVFYRLLSKSWVRASVGPVEEIIRPKLLRNVEFFYAIFSYLVTYSILSGVSSGASGFIPSFTPNFNEFRSYISMQMRQSPELLKLVEKLTLFYSYFYIPMTTFVGQEWFCNFLLIFSY